jgi:hypothetical protein
MRWDDGAVGLAGALCALLSWGALSGCGPEAASKAEPGPTDSGAPAGDTGWAAVGDPATVALGGACPLDQRWGGFGVDLGPRYSAVSGAVADGVVPITVLREGPREGDCVLLERENPRCDPPCGPSEACDFDGSCLPYPLNQDLGLVTLRGLAVPVRMAPTPPGTTYFDSAVPNPAVAPDALVQLEAPGGALGPLLLHGVGPEPLVSDTLAWVVGDGDLPLRWTAPVGLGRGQVEARLMIDQHGLSPYTLVCRFEDDGEAALPATLVRALTAAGVSGFPSGTLRRLTEDHRALHDGGCVDLTVSATQLATVEVEGHIPCDSLDDCPPGQLCNLALETCQ